MCLRWFCSLALASVAAFARHAHAFDETTPSAAALSQARSVQDRQDREREAMRPDAMALGLWVTKDDDSEVAMAWVRLSLVGDHLSGRIEKILDPQAKPDERCTCVQGIVTTKVSWGWRSYARGGGMCKTVLGNKPLFWTLKTVKSTG